MSEFQFLDYRFKDPELLKVALTHKSSAHEQKVVGPHNEKLEFLGDAVLDLVMGEALMEFFPEADEGTLSKMRAHLVNESNLAAQAEALELSKFMILGKGEQVSGGSSKPRLLASSFEAIVGAVHLEAGYTQVRDLIKKLFAPQFQEILERPGFDLDYKSQLQELVQGISRKTPVYELKSQSGPPHDRSFEVVCLVGDIEISNGVGKTKKAAEQRAAEAGLLKYSQSPKVQDDGK